MNLKPHKSTPPYPPLVLLLATTLFLGVNPIHAQESLRDMVQQRGAGWMVGKWTGTNSEGQTIILEYEWELDGHALEIDLKMGGFAYQGTVVRRPQDGAVIEVGADNGGGMTHSTWNEKDGLLITERTGTRPSGEVARVAVINKQLDADTVKATVHSLSADGKIGEDPMDTVMLTRVAADTDDD